MFLILLVAEVILSLGISWCIVRILSQSIEKIISRITSDATSRAWLKFVKFAIYVAGVSGGVRLVEKDVEEFLGMMERGIEGVDPLMYRYVIARLAVEICGAAIGTLRGIFWFLSYFFIAVAIAFVIIRVTELIKSKPADTQDRA
jgi:uncharacterized membrane protein